MSLIDKINAYEILDSRGNPTLEVEVHTTMGNFSRAAVPSGASTSKKECVELRDREKRFHGMGVLKAIRNVNTIIADKLLKIEVTDQSKIDQTLINLDGTYDKSNLGGNAILGVSLSCLKAGSMDMNLPLFKYIGSKNGINKFRLPVPFMNVINGGRHANNNLDIQEFMLVPKMDTFFESLQACVEIYQTLKKNISNKNLSTAVGDEGGFAPNLSSNKGAIELILEACTQSGYEPGKNIFLALDVAASEFYKNGNYQFEGSSITSENLLDIYKKFSKDYPLISLEDPFSEDDHAGWRSITKLMGNKLQIIGDDLFVTNTNNIKLGIDKKLANSLLVKCNQVGTFSETVDAVKLARKHNFVLTMSHRSGDTEDHVLADLAVGLDCEQIKTGAACRSERTSKYNQLIRIEKFLNL